MPQNIMRNDEHINISEYFKKRPCTSGFRQTVIVAAPAHQTTLTGLNKYTKYSIIVFASTN